MSATNPASRPATSSTTAAASATATGRLAAVVAENGRLDSLVTVILTLALAFIPGWAIADARWVLGNNDLTAFLPIAALAGAGWGLLASRLGWGRLRAHVVGALIAGVALDVMAGSAIAPAKGALGIGAIPAWIGVSGASALNAYVDLVMKAHQITVQTAHYQIMLGIITWGTAHFLAYASAHHRRPLSGVLAGAGVLVINIALAKRDQLPALVLFTLIALVFLVRSHLLDERADWLRRRIGDAGVASVGLRSGIAFSSIAVVAALILTTFTAPPGGSQGFSPPDWAVTIGRRLAEIFPGGADASRIGGVSFSTSLTVSGAWTPDHTAEFSAVRAGSATGTGVTHWRAIAYDQFDGTGWSVSSQGTQNLAADAPAVVDPLDGGSTTVDRQAASITVTPLDSSFATLVGPNLVASASVPTTATWTGADGTRFFGRLQLTGPPSTYTVNALVPIVDPAGKKGLTAAALRSAGTDYPASIADTYLQIRTGTVGDGAAQLLATIQGSTASLAESPTPYDLAKAVETYLRDPANFTYDTDVRSLSCSSSSIVDCFIVTRHGYCEHYASTMTVLMRLAGVPARMVEGFLPGTTDAKGVEAVTRDRAHAWVEVYFPGHGWVEFDPTGGGIGSPTILPAGPSPTPAPSAAASADPNQTSKPAATKNLDGASTAPGGTTPTGGGLSGPIVAVLVILGSLLAIAAIGTLVFRRTLVDGPATPEAAWLRILRLARRVGLSPRPGQTVYEYSRELSAALPTARAEIAEVARLKVEATYRPSASSPDAPARLLVETAELRAAETRLRSALLRRGLDRILPRRR